MTASVYPDSIPDLDIKLDTPEWFSWLESQQQFKYIGNLTEVNVKRRSNGKWYARKKVYSSNGSKPIDLYIGSDSECTAEKLKEINLRFGQDWTKFWEWYYSPDRTAQKNVKGKGVQPEEVYTPNELSSQIQSEIEGLKAENDELKRQLAELQKKYEYEADCAKRYYPNWRKFPGLESELRYHKGKSAKAEELIEVLKSAKRYKLHRKEVIQVESFEPLLQAHYPGHAQSDSLQPD